MKPELSVVVPILGYDSIGAFMQTLQVAWTRSIEVIVLDSTPFGKRHDTVNYDESGKSTIIRTIIDPPMGFHETWNLGLRMARGDYIALVNDDLLFGHLSLEHCVQAIDKFELPCVYPMHTSGPAQLERFEAEGRNVAELPLALVGPSEYRGFCWVMTRDLQDIVGSFDEQFELYYGDKDYWYRLIKEGYPPRCIQNALVHHFEGRTIKIIESATKKDFRAIGDADFARFKQKWGETNAKQLLREMKLKEKK